MKLYIVLRGLGRADLGLTQSTSSVTGGQILSTGVWTGFFVSVLWVSELR